MKSNSLDGGTLASNPSDGSTGADPDDKVVAVSAFAENPGAAEQLEALFAAMTDRVIVVDYDGRFLQVPVTNAPPVLMRHLWAEQGSSEHPANASVTNETEQGQLASIRRAIDEQERVTFEYPLVVAGETYWMSAVATPLSGKAALVMVRDVTERENARLDLERRVEERTRELSALLDVSRDIGLTIELAPLLELIVDHVRQVVEYSRCSVYLLEGPDLVLAASRQSEGTRPLPRLPVSALLTMWDTMARGEAAIIDDIRGDTELAVAYRHASGDLFEAASVDISCWMAVPLAVKDRMIGMLTVSHPSLGFYNEHHARVARGIAAQVAVAIENVRLHEQSVQFATVQERQRLARELHDSVSQALYGIALGAQTAQSLLSEDSQARQPVDYVLGLAETGLAEMRALIFELRPESLEAEGLVGAFKKQALAMSSRYHLPIHLDMDREPSLGVAQREVFYRIGMEALNNIVKHAQATSSTIRLTQEGASVVLEVKDDGIGFDASGTFPGHIGLVSMQERAASIDAAVEVTSLPGSGTSVVLTLSAGASTDPHPAA
jgi:signal transduction histidine kinase